MSLKWPSFGRNGWQVSPEYAITVAIMTDVEKDEYRIVDWKVMVVRNNRKDIMFVQVVGRDATSRLNAMHKKYEKEEMLEAIIKNNPQGIVVVKNFKIIMMNEEVTKVLGYAQPENLNTLFNDYVHHDDISRVTRSHNLRMSGVYNETQEYYIRLRHKQGHYSTFSMRVMSIKLGGELHALTFLSESDEIVKIQCQTIKFIINTLSPGETTVLKLFFEGKKRAEILRHTGWQSQQIDTNVRRIREKLGIDDLKKWIQYYQASYDFLDRLVE